jgi:hypothetical protein
LPLRAACRNLLRMSERAVANLNQPDLLSEFPASRDG